MSLDYQISERSYIISGGTYGARQKTQVQCRHYAISLPCPLRENEAFRAFPADDGA